ncbi:MAG TPA: DUF167 family protein [Actinomycetota bacterium]
MERWVRGRGDGCSISVRVSPRASRPGVSLDAGGIHIRVRSPAAEGRATAEAARLLAEALGAPPSAVSLRSGPRSRSKVFRVAGMAPEEAVRRLREAL